MKPYKQSRRSPFKILLIIGLIVAAIYFRGPIIQFFSSRVNTAKASTATTQGSSQAAKADQCPFGQPAQPKTLSLGVVIDPTSSTAASFAQGVLSALAARVSQQVPAKPTTPQNSVATIDALDIRLIQVGTNPFAYDGTPELHLQIPGVQGLPQRPSISDDKCLQNYRTWSQHKQAWSQAYDAAATAARTASQRLATWPLNTQGTSGIRAAVSALASALPGGQHTAYLVASDLDENQPVQTAGNLGGSPVILVEACPSGNAADCATRATNFSNWAKSSLHAGPTTLFRPENTTEAVSKLFQEATR